MCSPGPPPTATSARTTSPAASTTPKPANAASSANSQPSDSKPPANPPPSPSPPLTGPGGPATTPARTTPGGHLKPRVVTCSFVSAITRILRADIIVVDDIGLLPVGADAAE